LNARLGGRDNGEIVIVSVNFGNIEFFVRRNRWDEAPRLPDGKIKRLERGGRGRPDGSCDPRCWASIRSGASGYSASDAIRGTAAALPGSVRGAILVPNDSDMAIVDRIIFDELVRRELRPGGFASMAAAQRPVARNELLNWLSRNQKKSAIWAKSDSFLPIAKDVKAWRLLQIDWRVTQMRPADRRNQKL
jgi:hypothetical protein